MGNAIPQVKEIADDCTVSCDEDGVAVYLEKNVLNGTQWLQKFERNNNIDSGE